MSEKPKRTLMQDLESCAAEVSAYPSYMRTQSSAARYERDMRRAGLDPITRLPLKSLIVREQISPAEPITPDADYSTETFRTDISG